MHIYRFLFVFPIALSLTCVSFGQSNSFIEVYFEAANDSDVVYLSGNNIIQESTIIMNKQARFSLPKKVDEWATYFITYKSKERRFTVSLFHNAQSDIRLSVDKDFWQFTLSGDTNVAEQNEFYNGLFAIGKEYRLLEKQLSETTDSVHMLTLKKEIESLDKRSIDYSVNWVLQHTTSPFSASVIRIMIDRSHSMRSLDTVAANCFDKLLPSAIKNNLEARLIQRQFSFYSEKYSIVATNTKAPAFLIKDTTGNEVKPEQFKGKWLLIDFWASWCGPCRQSNPLLKDFFETYHDKGLEVLSISVDTDSEQWKKAIKIDKMSWHQGSDLLGLDLGVGQSYQIIAVPTYFLVSPEGVIVAKSVGDINKIVERVKRILDTESTGGPLVPQ